MAKHNWNITYRKNGLEMWVSNAYREIFIGDVADSIPEPYRKKNITIAKIICIALNNHNPFKPNKEKK